MNGNNNDNNNVRPAFYSIRVSFGTEKQNKKIQRQMLNICH